MPEKLRRTSSQNSTILISIFTDEEIEAPAKLSASFTEQGLTELGFEPLQSADFLLSMTRLES